MLGTGCVLHSLAALGAGRGLQAQPRLTFIALPRGASASTPQSVFWALPGRP